MNQEIKVSVVIPMYNSIHFILDALESVLEQSFPCEIIVVDDCSTDGSDEVARNFLSRQNSCPWKLLKNMVNSGVAFSRNRGVEAAQGKYIAFLDSDDVWRRGKLRKQYELMEETGTVLSTTARKFIDGEGIISKKTVPVKEVISYSDMLKTNQINLSASMIKREVALEFPMEHPELHEDYITWLKVLKKYGEARGINEALLLYRKLPDSKSAGKLNSAVMHYKSLRVSGIPALRAAVCFVSYAVNGIRKHGGLK